MLKLSKKKIVFCFISALIIIGLFSYYPIKVLITESMGHLKPTGWYINSESEYFSLKGRKRNEVVQWLQGMPFEFYPMGYRYESPYTFDEWLKKGEKIEDLEETLLSLYNSR